MMSVLNRVGVIFALTFQEARRRRLLIIFLIGCILFMGGGATCTNGCRHLERSGFDQYRWQVEQQMIQKQVPQAEQKRQLAELDHQYKLQQKESERTLQSALVIVGYGLIAFWSYLLAAFFIPFLAFNDFATNLHVLILARPVRRWEYLFGKFAAAAGLVLASAALLLLCYFPLMKFVTGGWGFEILRGLLYLLQGIIVWILLLMFLSLATGRLIAVFLGLVVLALGIVPGYLIALQTPLEGGITGQAVVYLLGYGLPQLTVNFVHGFGAMAVDLPGLEEMVRESGLRKIGNHSAWHAILLNFAWIALLWTGLVLIFRRRELDA